MSNLKIIIHRNLVNEDGTWGEIFYDAGEGPIHLGFSLEPNNNSGKGAIPTGEYSCARWISPTMGETIRLYDVPGFTNILIHPGNTLADTKGCILVGENVDNGDEPKKLVNSRKIVSILYIKNPSQIIVE